MAAPVFGNRRRKPAKLGTESKVFRKYVHSPYGLFAVTEDLAKACDESGPLHLCGRDCGRYILHAELDEEWKVKAFQSTKPKSKTELYVPHHPGLIARTDLCCYRCDGKDAHTKYCTEMHRTAVHMGVILSFKGNPADSGSHLAEGSSATDWDQSQTPALQLQDSDGAVLTDQDVEPMRKRQKVKWER